MLNSQYILPNTYNDLIVDSFAGGGGASTGIELATGRYPDIAINHDAVALGMHAANHPQTKHFVEDIFKVKPIKATNGKPVSLMWASPDCKHFSKAKGKKPVSKRIRGLAWVVVRWAKEVRPKMIVIENVEEFKTWGPLKGDYPDPEKKGETFKKWIKALEGLGYKIDYRELRACDYGAPTSRKRLFIICRCDGKPIVWPEPTHGDPNKKETKEKGLKPWKTAADSIDWTIPCPSIFERKKPLKEKTLRRIAKGMDKYVINNPKPFIISIANFSSMQMRSTDEPLSTVTANPKGGHHALVVPIIKSHTSYSQFNTINKPVKTICAKGYQTLVAPTLIQYHGEQSDKETRGQKLDEPIMTIDSSPRYALVAAFMAKHFGAVGSKADKPLGTITSVDHNSLVTSHIVKFRGQNYGHKTDEPLQTISAGGVHFGEVRAFLLKYYKSDKNGANIKDPMPTITTKDRLGLVICKIDGEEYAIADIGMRMLQPHELFAAQGFPKNYKFDFTASGKKLTKTEQVRMCGNSVCPPIAKAIIQANYIKE
ncbi:MAG: DNA cytosine methyltransferase [Endomicrobiaceae bacterium]|nr:DNA cytosine methyltransferase [Endomicrobiaceae bacterium]